jgi:hypothetical protein
MSRTASALLTLRGVSVIVDVSLVFVLTRRILVRVMCVIRPRVVVLVRVHGRQVLYRPCSTSLSVMGHMDMFVAVNDVLMIM